MPWRGPSWGTPSRPVRTNNNLMVNGPPDGWVRDQLIPVGWLSGVADDGTPPAWWEGRSEDADVGPIGPHGPWQEFSQWGGQAVITHATSLVVDPLTRYRLKDHDAEVPLWLRDPQLLRPDDRVGPSLLPALQRLPAVTFWRDWLVSALWWGSGFLFFHEDAEGQPKAGTLRLLNPWHLHWDDGAYRLGDDLWLDQDGRVTLGGVTTRVVRLRNPHGPLGVFWSNPEVFTLGKTLSKYEQGTFRSGIPNGYLKVSNPAPITQEQADDLKARWMEAHGGDSRSIAVLNAYTEFHAIQLSPVDSGLGEVKRLNLANVAFAFNLSPALLGTSVMAGGGTMTYANLQQWWEQRRDVTLPPWLAAVEQTLSSLLPGRAQVEVNLDEYAYGTFGQRVAMFKEGTEAGLDAVALAAELGLPYQEASDASGA